MKRILQFCDWFWNRMDVIDFLFGLLGVYIILASILVFIVAFPLPYKIGIILIGFLFWWIGRTEDRKPPRPVKQEPPLATRPPDKGPALWR